MSILINKLSLTTFEYSNRPTPRFIVQTRIRGRLNNNKDFKKSPEVADVLIALDVEISNDVVLFG